MEPHFGMKRLFLLCTLLAGLAAADEPIVPQGAGAVDLRFDWPRQQPIRVTLTRTIKDEGHVQKMTLYYQLSAEADGKSILVKTRRIEDSLNKTFPEEPANMLQAMAAVAFPDIRVKSGGQYIGLKDPQSASRQSRAFFEHEIARQPEVDPKRRAKVEPLLDTLTSPTYLNAATADNWNRLVGTWSGSSLQVGKVYETRGRSGANGLGPSGIPVIVQTVLKPAPDCARAGKAYRCVLVESTEDVADPAAMAKYLNAMIKRWAPPGNQPKMPSAVNLETRSSLLTEPATLLPHRLEIVKEIRMPDVSGVDSSDVQVMMFEYP